jgi:hypothetical protein
LTCRRAPAHRLARPTRAQTGSADGVLAVTGGASGCETLDIHRRQATHVDAGPISQGGVPHPPRRARSRGATRSCAACAGTVRHLARSPMREGTAGGTAERRGAQAPWPGLAPRPSRILRSRVRRFESCRGRCWIFSLTWASSLVTPSRELPRMTRFCPDFLDVVGRAWEGFGSARAGPR